MKIRSGFLVLCIVIAAVLLSASGKAEKDTSESDAAVIIEEMTGILENTVPAGTADNCDGFCDLKWDDTIDDLCNNTWTEVVVRGTSFAGYNGSAYYLFDEDDILNKGTLRFNENNSLNWSESMKMFLNIRKYLSEKYGEPDLLNRESMKDNSSDLEALIKEGKGRWDEMWTKVSDEYGRRVNIILSIQENTEITLSFIRN